MGRKAYAIHALVILDRENAALFAALFPAPFP